MTPQPNPTARVASPTPEIKPFHCPRCKAKLAETNGSSLRFPTAAFPFPVTFSCLSCGGMVKWRPVVEGNGKRC